ncbi:putative protein phosphatase 2C 24 [Camellia lanceoleosa]|uniref:Uncharacterized protein n=1 Tax=Camellia lanceoleosa TaxID=1840588 RepID=A0ACC0J618_9ERIC|nr:putative protein phosphatase 2C 24 [Camellia lanceoleosa]
MILKSEVVSESPPWSLLDENESRESRDGYGSVKRRLVKKLKRVDSFDVEAMEIASFQDHHAKVAMKCRDWLHELGKEEIEKKDSSTEEWKIAMERSFNRMDNEVIAWNDSVLHADCRCELQTPECNTVGSTAVVAVVTPDKIIVANYGDSRAVLCHNSKAIPLSTDHKDPSLWQTVALAFQTLNVVYGDMGKSPLYVFIDVFNKSQSLLVTARSTVKIGDFSVSQVFEDDNDELRRSPGTPVFIAPECCLG